MTSPAFVGSFAPVIRPSTAFFGRNTVSPIRPSAVAFAPRMALKAPDQKKTTTSAFQKLEADREAKLASEYRGPQGFTPYAEKVNGRLAQLGFVIGLVTELASGKPIGQQILIMFSPLTNALATVFHTIGN